MVLYPSGLRERSAKPSFIGSNPIGTFNVTSMLIQLWRRKLHLKHSDAVFVFREGQINSNLYGRLVTGLPTSQIISGTATAYLAVPHHV